LQNKLVVHSSFLLSVNKNVVVYTIIAYVHVEVIIVHCFYLFAVHSNFLRSLKVTTYLLEQVQAQQMTFSDQAEFQTPTIPSQRLIESTPGDHLLLSTNSYNKFVKYSFGANTTMFCFGVRIEYQ